MRTSKNTKNVKADLRNLADVVQREVDAGADTVEEIHLAIARMPLEVLAKLDVFEQATKEVRKLQDTSIGAIYDLIRKVNHEVAGLAKDLLDGRGSHAKPAKRPAPKRAAAERRSAAPRASVAP